jgi:hypothetical protein
MNATHLKTAALLGVVWAMASAGCADAQAGQNGLAARVAAAPDGEVWMHFASRPGVCGNENGGISTSHRSGRTRVVVNGSDDEDWECEEGPVWVALVKRSGAVQRLRMRIARPWRAPEERRVTDLGVVGVHEASGYLLSLAERSTVGNVGEEAIVPATLADSVTTWPTLLRLAKNAQVTNGARRSAVFWLSQQAGDRITHELALFVSDSEEDRELRKHAVFALSQRPREEAVPELMRIARTHRDPEIRKSAMFWLGQSGDPRALALFEEILRH